MRGLGSRTQSGSMETAGPSGQSSLALRGVSVKKVTDDPFSGDSDGSEASDSFTVEARSATPPQRRGMAANLSSSLARPTSAPGARAGRTDRALERSLLDKINNELHYMLTRQPLAGSSESLLAELRKLLTPRSQLVAAKRGRRAEGGRDSAERGCSMLMSYDARKFYSHNLFVKTALVCVAGPADFLISDCVLANGHCGVYCTDPGVGYGIVGAEGDGGEEPDGLESARRAGKARGAPREEGEDYDEYEDYDEADEDEDEDEEIPTLTIKESKISACQVGVCITQEWLVRITQQLGAWAREIFSASQAAENARPDKSTPAESSGHDSAEGSGDEDEEEEEEEDEDEEQKEDEKERKKKRPSSARASARKHAPAPKEPPKVRPGKPCQAVLMECTALTQTSLAIAALHVKGLVDVSRCRMEDYKHLGLLSWKGDLDSGLQVRDCQFRASKGPGLVLVSPDNCPETGCDAIVGNRVETLDTDAVVLQGMPLARNYLRLRLHNLIPPSLYGPHGLIRIYPE